MIDLSAHALRRMHSRSITPEMIALALAHGARRSPSYGHDASPTMPRRGRPSETREYRVTLAEAKHDAELLPLVGLRFVARADGLVITAFWDRRPGRKGPHA